MTKDTAPMSFEQALARLDEVVAQLEGGEVGLEEAVGLFAEGQRHLSTCRERLAGAQQRIEELTSASNAISEGGGDEPF
jgi:exodeoxyribonuclease VII small subunit